MEELRISVNGIKYRLFIEPWESLNYVIRERLGLTGTKKGCETGGCGSCTVVIDGKPIYSCMMLALQAEGKEILTIEGLQKEGKLDPVQIAFMNAGALQCGYCTPGFIMVTWALLRQDSNPSESKIRDFLVGNICRCTGYVKIIEAVKMASRLISEAQG